MLDRNVDLLAVYLWPQLGMRSTRGHGRAASVAGPMRTVLRPSRCAGGSLSAKCDDVISQCVGAVFDGSAVGCLQFRCPRAAGPLPRCRTALGPAAAGRWRVRRRRRCSPSTCPARYYRPVRSVRWAACAAFGKGCRHGGTSCNKLLMSYNISRRLKPSYRAQEISGSG
jgi:hypothetical protein